MCNCNKNSSSISSSYMEMYRPSISSKRISPHRQTIKSFAKPVNSNKNVRVPPRLPQFAKYH